ncbi:MAG: RecX family transcriptional regulator, partial [Lachnospira sp.]|nr:RecX family transcriptional regulator [Lachnospira sp.]
NKRWLVYINYEPAFVLYIGELKRFDIKEDACISKAYYEDIKELLSKRATVRAMSLLKSKDYTVQELKNKLEQGYYSNQAVEHAIEYVSSYGYLNDERYAANYITFKAGSKSKRQIVGFLQQKGISQDIIERTCDEYYEENSDAELTQIVTHMRKKLGREPVEPDYETQQKLMAYYYRKGFSSDNVRKALDVVVNELFNN